MISIEKLEGEISRRLEGEMEKEEALSRVPMLKEVIAGYLRRPAKLLRPRLLLESATAYAKGNRGAPDEALYRLATATELLHVFALMHDDRVDSSGRAGVELPSTVGREAFMLLAGDLLHAVSVEMIRECVTAFSLSQKILRRVHSVSVRTIAGQALEVSRYDGARELPDLLALYDLYDLKTGYYSFVAPLVTGALATGDSAAEGDAAVLEEAGLLLGRAFQLKDDVEDTSALIDEPPQGNLPPWELALLVAYLYKENDPETAGRLLEPGRSLGELLEGIDSRTLVSWSQGEIRSLLAEAEERFTALNLGEKERKRLFGRAVEIAELHV